MKSIRNHWGNWAGQTVGTRKDEINYIQGYTPNGKLVKIVYEEGELNDLLESLLNVQRRRENL